MLKYRNYKKYIIKTICYNFTSIEKKLKNARHKISEMRDIKISKGKIDFHQWKHGS